MMEAIQVAINIKPIDIWVGLIVTNNIHGAKRY